MSNQNNTMQKMEIFSNVNLSRYKKDIDGSVKVNDCSTPVIGNKFTPLKREDTNKTDEYLMETDTGLYGYNNGMGCYEYNKSLIDFANEKNAICVYTSNYGNSGIFTYENDDICFYYLSDKIKHSLNFSTFSQSYKGKIGFSRQGDHDVILLYTDTDYLKLDIDTLIGNYYSAPLSEVFGEVELETILDYVSETSYYILGERKNFIIGKSYVNGDPRVCLIALNNLGNIITYQSPANTKWYTFGKLGLLTIDSNGVNRRVVFCKNEQYFRTLEMGYNGSPNTKIDDRYNELIYNLTEYKILDEKIERNGFIFSKSIKYGSNDKFKVLSSINFSSYTQLSVKYTTSIENNELKDNCIYCVESNGNEFWIFQGCNIVLSPNIPMGIIDQNFESGIYRDIFRDNSGNWHHIACDEWGTNKNSPIEIGNKIYFADKIRTVKNASNVIYTNRNTYEGFKYTSIDISSEAHKVYYTSIDDWNTKSRYWVLGNTDKENPYFIQFAPVLSGCANEILAYGKKLYIREIYAQVNATDSTLYNYVGEAYTAPTDNDFYIPLMPSDKIIGKVLDRVIIERIDGSRAELLRYNNKYYPLYNFSTIAENIDYTFVCQGQIYTVANNIIYDSNSTGVADVSDMKYLGGNGIIVLFFNHRSKSIYQFSASNGVEVLFTSDNIKNIILTDVNNTNDEVYIYYEDFDDKKRLICIESDGSIYNITSNNLTKFQIGKSGVFTWENGHIYKYSILLANDTLVNKYNNYIETNFLGTDEFKLVNFDRIFLRFAKTSSANVTNNVTVSLTMLNIEGEEILEQYKINVDKESIHRIAPKQKNCIGLKIRLDGLNDYTLTALSVGVNDDSNVVVNNRVINNRLDSSIFD